ncbi:unnamed protein product [Mytilus coruscus]|uniref:PiggyBac transposable element-derived protein domain-containing protein n=1 Tax=Mytilus coruscus TaxID=42192 RepID=A0A6J8EKB1_MYTCO|nr:unnamed protein product [Mytilus coruscus]
MPIAENPDSNKSSWSKPSLPEIKDFIDLCFLMEIDVKPESKLYWSTDPFMESPIFRKTMSRNRFMQIMRYLHFSDNHNAQQPGHPSCDVIYKIRNILNIFDTSMKREFVPTCQVSIDECMIPFKGRVKFKQYMPAKPTKWGIKIWALADSNTGYICYTDVYTGQTDRPQGQMGAHVVKKCIEGADIVGQGYHVLFLLSPNHQTVGNSPAMTYLQFSRQIASSLIDGYCGIGTRGRQSEAPVPSRLTERHMPNIVGKNHGVMCVG